MPYHELKHPKGYHVTVEDDRFLILRRPDATEVWRFDPAAVLDYEVALAAFEDHSKRLMELAWFTPSKARCS